MRIRGDSHLTYCTNVHAGESLAEVERNLQVYVAEVKKLVCPDAPFGVGLWLSARAAEELREPAALVRLRARHLARSSTSAAFEAAASG